MNMISLSRCLLILYLVFTPLSLVGQSWKTYPYQPQGSAIIFPTDEGWHPSAPMEWWYLNAHFIGLSTNDEYSLMLSYFYVPIIQTDGMRLINISNDSKDEFYHQTIFCDYSTLSNNHLLIKTQPHGAMDEWSNLLDSDGKLKPFEYFVSATANFASINLDLISEKKPLLIGSNGFLNQGTSGNTNYYSLTKLTLKGTLELNETSEEIIGTAWIDHQYGNLFPTIGEKYEWFSIQLSNGIDINLWNIFKDQNLIPDSPQYKICGIYFNDSKDTTVSNFELTRLKYSYMPNSSSCYSQQWRFAWEEIDLTITVKHNNREVNSHDIFYEGSTTISGTVHGEEVTGIGFAELLHSYENPIVKFSDYEESSNEDLSSIKWNLLNPDDGRPIYYDLEISNDNGMTFKPITRNSLDNSINISKSDLKIDKKSILRITGYSMDSTLTGSDITTIGELVSRTNSPDFYLLQNYPNPFNPKTTIKFTLPEGGKINLSVYNSLGELVDLIFTGVYDAGTHEILFDASRFSSGIYICVLKVNEVVLNQKIVLAK